MHPDDGLTPEPADIVACPECGETDLTCLHSDSDKTTYECQWCGEEFVAPNEPEEDD